MGLLKVNNGHTFISGITRSGKTYFAARAVEQLPFPVIFFNLQDEDLPHKFLTVRADEVYGDQLIDAMKAGVKLDLRFRSAAADAEINNVIGFVCRRLMSAGFSEKIPVYIVFDECHLLSGYGIQKAIEVATRGLKRGCRAVFITQRPALANKTLYTQSSDQYIFYLSPSEAGYLKSKGIDYERCLADWERLGKHSYIYYDGYTYEPMNAI